ncbi:MAG: GAF domain-containing protein [Thermomicrobiales bacterium]
MLRSVLAVSPEVETPANPTSARALLRYVDRAALDELTAAFVDAVDLPTALVSASGDPITALPRGCPMCNQAPVQESWPRTIPPAGSSGWVRCRHGLSCLRVPISARAGGVIAWITIGPLAVSDADYLLLQREMSKLGPSETVTRSQLKAVRRSTSQRVESSARLFARTLETIVREAAIASDNADLVATQRQANRELSVLYAVARALGAGTELRSILQKLVEVVVDQMGSDVALVGLVEDGDLVTVASYGLLTFEAKHGRLKVGEGLAGRVAAAGTPLTCDDMQEDPRQYLTAINSREQLHAFAGVPLTLQGSTVGVLAVYRRVPYTFLDSERQLLSHIADQAAVAMERARLYDQERTAIGELRTLHAQVERQHRALERATAVHDQLTQMVLENAGLEAIVDALARLLESTVLVEDQFQHVLAQGAQDQEKRARSSPPSRDSARKHVDWERAITTASDSRRPVAFPMAPDRDDSHPGVVAPVIVGGDLLGYLSVLENNRALEEQDLLAIGHASTVIALEMMKQRTRAEVERRLRGELLEVLLSDGVRDGDAVQRRAAYLGYNLASPHTLMFVAAEHPASESQQAGRGSRHSLADILEDLVNLQGRGGALTLARADGAILAVPLQNGTLAEAHAIAQTLQRDARLRKGIPLQLAIGRICRSPADFAISSAEAKRALDFARSFDRAEQILSFEELGVCRLLLDLPRASDAVRFANELLSPLEQYDAEHRTELLPTLDAYLAANGVQQRAAAALGIHVNTLGYRLQRIREVARIDLENSESRLELHLALKIHQTMFTQSRDSLQHTAVEFVGNPHRLAAPRPVG